MKFMHRIDEFPMRETADSVDSENLSTESFFIFDMVEYIIIKCVP